MFSSSTYSSYLTINNGITGEGTSSPVGHSSPADEPNEEFKIMLVKEEESEDEGSVCTMTVCSNTATLTKDLFTVH